jgi:hypothetical protein
MPQDYKDYALFRMPSGRADWGADRGLAVAMETGATLCALYDHRHPWSTSPLRGSCVEDTDTTVITVRVLILVQAWNKPTCSLSFRKLKDRKHFCPEIHLALKDYVAPRPEHFWQCNSCSGPQPTCRASTLPTFTHRESPIL